MTPTASCTILAPLLLALLSCCGDAPLSQAGALALLRQSLAEAMRDEQVQIHLRDAVSAERKMAIVVQVTREEMARAGAGGGLPGFVGGPFARSGNAAARGAAAAYGVYELQGLRRQRDEAIDRARIKQLEIARQLLRRDERAQLQRLVPAFFDASRPAAEVIAGMEESASPVPPSR